MSEWGLEIFDANGESVDMENAIPLELLAWDNIDSTKVFEKEYSFPNLSDNATLVVIPDAWGLPIETSTTKAEYRPLTVTYNYNGDPKSVYVSFQGGKDISYYQSGNAYGLSFVAIFATYSPPTSGWGLWESVTSSYPSMSVGSNGYFFYKSGTVNFNQRAWLGNNGYAWEYPQDINTQIGATTEDLVFWRHRAQNYACFYCPGSYSGTGVCTYAPDYSSTDAYENTYQPRITNYGEWSPTASVDMDYIIFRRQTTPTPSGYGFAMYAKDGTAAFSSSVTGKPFTLAAIVDSPDTPCAEPYDRGTLINGWGTYITLDPAYASTAFYTLPMLGLNSSDQFGNIYSGPALGLQRVDSGDSRRLYVGTAFKGSQGNYETFTCGNSYHQEKIFIIDGANYGFDPI